MSNTMEQALRDHGLIVLEVKDVERLLGKWQRRSSPSGEGELRCV